MKKAFLFPRTMKPASIKGKPHFVNILCKAFEANHSVSDVVL